MVQSIHESPQCDFSTGGGYGDGPTAGCAGGGVGEGGVGDGGGGADAQPAVISHTNSLVCMVPEQFARHSLWSFL